ncbi:MAG: penicillin-binding protein 1A [Gammaproteobacteria bacterium]|nr:penicillin-binding protein 1A [Gammaproteobacteria bacterium]
MLRFILNFCLSLAILGAAALAALTLYIVPGLPEIDALRDVQMQVPLRVFSSEGLLISEFGEKRRVPVGIGDVPQTLINAVIAAEDDRFYRHPGVDWQGILRAAIHLARTGEKTQGGSTITMQVARNFFLSREKSYLRKLNEIFLALKIEQELSKPEILELYLNKIYLGQRAYGVGAAAQVYYGLEVRDLNLAQMAMVAGLPKAPSTTNPISNPERALQRREYVLQRMLELGFISREEYNQASVAPLSASLHSPDIEVEAPYVAETVRKQLVAQYGEDAYSAGYRVVTTIQGRHQAAANQALRLALLEYDERHGYRGPESHFEFDREAPDEDRWQSILKTFPAIGALYPALVTDVRGDSVTVYLSGIGYVGIGWDGLSWARRYITENQRGPAPATAADIVTAGDIVRIIEDVSGNWKLSQIPAIEGAIVSMRPDDGAVYALAGGFDFNRSKFNRIEQALRQPGSSFKPFIYSAALNAGFTAASIINDAPVVFDDPGIEEIWRPENYSGKYYGPTRLREALIHSRNLVSIRLLHAIGVPNAVEHIARFGFDTRTLPRNLSLALGSGAVTPWQLARAYSVFANGGYLIDPYIIDRIETHDGKDVFQAAPRVVCRACEEEADEVPAAVEEAAALFGVADAAEPDLAATSEAAMAPARAPRTVDAQNVWIMNSMTRDVIRHGTGRRALQLQRSDLSGKTGTTNDQRDAWFAGFNPHLVTVTWVGFDKFEPLGSLETGARAALPMWMGYMRVALQNVPETILERPEGLVNVRIDPMTGKLARVGNPDAIFEVFQAGTAPSDSASPSGLDPFYDEGMSRRAPEQLF